MKKKSLLSWIVGMLLKIIPSLETEIILRRAAKNGCDWDGDVLKFYVNEQTGVVQVFEI